MDTRGSSGILLRVPDVARIGRYTLLGELGRGGMAAVHLARMEGFGFERLVAVKVLQDELAAHSDARTLFLDEVRIAARISHPNIVSVLEAGETDTTVWLAMDLVHGVTLRELASCPTPGDLAASWPLVAAHVLADACEGLHAAHESRDEQGRPLRVVHRDVSPSNIMVGFDGVARVLDFGIARAVDQAHRTMTGQFRGKLGYASPEHLDGRPLDLRADVWALGVVLWEMLTRRRLFEARSIAEAVSLIGTRPIPTLTEAGADVPRGFDEIVSRCLQRDSERRYPSARALGDDLRLLLAEQLDVLGPGDVDRYIATVAPNARAASAKLIGEAEGQSSSRLRPISGRSPRVISPSWAAFAGALVGGALTWLLVG